MNRSELKRRLPGTIVSGLLILTGVLFLLEGRYRRQRLLEGWAPPEDWLRRNPCPEQSEWVRYCVREPTSRR